MSQDMMQALSGSSLLSLSVGTLPAVKSGMMLDANPFASQLALMTGPEAATSGPGTAGAATVDAVDTNFALALAQVAAPVTDAPVAAAAAAVVAEAGGFTDIPALPEDASPSQIIEAVLGGATKPAQTTGPVAAEVPAAKIVTAAPAPEIDAPREITPQAQSEAVAADEIAAEPHTARARRSVKLDQPVATAAEATTVAAPVVEPVIPAPVRPQAEAPDTGSARVAISTRPAPVAESAPAPAPAPAEETASAGRTMAPILPAASPPVATDTSRPALARDTASAGPTMAPIPPAVSQPVAVDESRPAPAAPSAQPAVLDVGVSPADTVAPVAETRPAQAAPAPVVAPRASAVPTEPGVAIAGAAPKLAQPALQSADAPRTFAASAAPSDASLVDTGSAEAGATETIITPQPASVSSVTEPAPVATSAAVSAPVASAPSLDVTEVAAPVPELARMTDPAAAAEIVQAFPIPAQPQRVTSAAPRTTLSATGQRAIQAAAQGARPAQALSALFDLDNPAAQLPATTLGGVNGLDAIAAAPAEAVPPAWVAALNAIASPVTTTAAFGLTAANAAANPQAAQLETLAFDAGFVGNVETQIARVMGGGQMVRMQIMPENLGRIDIEMLAGPDRDQIRIVTEHDAVRDTLVQSQVRLEQDLRGQANRTTDVTVELRQQSAGTSTSLGGGSAQQRGQSGQEAASAREATQRQTAADTTAESKSAQRRPRDNVRYA